jgi:hypothetical protein
MPDEKFNALYQGELSKAIDFLDEYPATEQELRAALINVMRRVAILQAAVHRLQGNR